MVFRQGDGGFVLAVQMMGGFVFGERQYPAGSWIVLTPPRRVVSPADFSAEFTQPIEMEW